MIIVLTIGVIGWGYLFIRLPKHRIFLLGTAWAIFLGTALFVINRPGISSYYLNYDHKGGPDQFFYAQNMIFIFAAGWLLRDRLSKNIVPKKAAVLTIGFIVYLVWSIPFGSSFGQSKVVYEYLRPVKPNIEKSLQGICEQR